MTIDDTEPLLTPQQVAALFRVDPKTVTRWASNGWIGSIRTPGGHRRFRESEIRALLAELTMPAAPTTASLTTPRRGTGTGPPAPAHSPSPPLNAREPVSSDDEPVG